MHIAASVYLVGWLDAHEGLSEGHRSKAAIEEEEADVGVDVEEGGHVQVVGQSGREPQDPDHTLGGLHLPRHSNTEAHEQLGLGNNSMLSFIVFQREHILMKLYCCK